MSLELMVEEAKKEEESYGGEFLGVASSVVIANAEAKGLKVSTPAWNELFIDIDSAAGKLWFEKNLNIVERSVGVESVNWSVSPSGEPDHFHVVVKLQTPLGNNLERIALQAILGSDLTREAFSYYNWRKDDPTPTIFFDKPTCP